MTQVWLAVGVVGLATVLIKASGPVLLGGRQLPPRLLGMVEVLAPALLGALVVTQVFGGDHRLVIDARAAGIAAAAVALLLKAPVLVVVIVAAATTAVVRAI